MKTSAEAGTATRARASAAQDNQARREWTGRGGTGDSRGKKWRAGNVTEVVPQCTVAAGG